MILKCNWRPAPFLLAITLIAGCKKAFVEPLAKEPPGKETADETGLMSTSGYLTESYPLPGRLAADFVWGINGHAVEQDAYHNNYAIQVDLMKELNVRFYRIDINNFDDGTVSVERHTRLLNLKAFSDNAGIQLIPVLRLPNNPVLFGMTPLVAQAAGYDLGKEFASKYKAFFKYYNLGNEKDNDVIKPNQPGDHREHYDSSKVVVLAAFFRGMIQGISEEDDDEVIVINNAGGNHWGYFTWLDEQHVDYDILGYNYYEPINEFVGVLATLQQQFSHKPVWLTEVNVRKKDSLNSKAVHVKRIEDYVAHLDQQSNIKGFFIYELLDEDNIIDEDDPESVEHRLGLVDWVTDYSYTSFTRKPVFYTYKFKVEEARRGFEDFIYSLYLFGNHRVPDPGGLSYWTGRVTSSRQVPAIINEFLGIEFNQAFVREQYLALYGHAADPTGLDYWTGRLQTDLSREELIAIFCNETEFWQLAGSTNAGWVNRMYQQLLGVAPTATQLTTWLTRLTNGDSKYSLALEFIHCEAYLRQFVLAQFNFLLRRNGMVDSQSIDWGYGLMHAGMSQVNFIKTLMNGKEFWQRAIQEGYVRNNPPYQF